MKFEKEHLLERIKFFDSLAKYAFAIVIIISSGIGGLLIAKEKLLDAYFKNLILLGSILVVLSVLGALYFLNKQYLEISKLKNDNGTI